MQLLRPKVDTESDAVDRLSQRTSAAALSVHDLAEAIGTALKNERHRLLAHLERRLKLVSIRESTEKSRVIKIANRVTAIESELRRMSRGRR
jgi:hypothetical protein